MSTDATHGEGAAAPDPILLAIECHRRADAAYDAALVAGRRSAYVEMTERRAYWGLVETAPTTLAGCVSCAPISPAMPHVTSNRPRLHDYNPERGWHFGPRLLRNLRDVLERIEQAAALACQSGGQSNSPSVLLAI
jgi:hypothetical protein